MAIGKYRLEVVYQGQGELDDKLIKIVRKRHWASGLGPDGRDLNFCFDDVKSRDSAATRLQKANIPGVVVNPYDIDEN